MGDLSSNELVKWYYEILHENCCNETGMSVELGTWWKSFATSYEN